MSSITNLAASLTSAIEREAKELECSRQQLEHEKETLAAEKRRMTSFAVAGTDLVKINVGGKVFQTHRSTLLLAEGTLLEAIFSGRWEDSLVRDEMGNVFFDFDPTPFRALLNYLRTRSLTEPGHSVPLPQVPQEYKAQFEAMVSFMGLQDTIYGKMPPPDSVALAPDEAMVLSQAGCRDSRLNIAGGRLQSTLGGHRCVVGGAPLLRAGAQQKCAWKVTISHLASWVLAGVTTNPTPPDSSQSDAGTYGWAGKATGQVWSGGVHQGDGGGWPGWQTGDVAIFQVDPLQQVLRMHLLRTGMVYTLPLPPHLVQSARLHFNLCNAGNVVEVSQVSEQELSEVGF